MTSIHLPSSVEMGLVDLFSLVSFDDQLFIECHQKELPVSRNKEGKRRCEQYNFNTCLHHHIQNENDW